MDDILPLVDFSKVKKKRRQEEPDNEEQDDTGLDDFFSKKTKKKKTKTAKSKTNVKEIENEENTNGAYPYDFLLKRLYNIMNTQKDSSGADIKLPSLVLGEGANSRTTWVNFENVAKALGRSKEHLFSFIVAELSIEATFGGDGQLFFKTNQKVTQQMLKSLLKKYIDDFVRCPNCKSFKTILRKDQSTRLPQIYCEICKGEKTIQTIKSRGGGGGGKKRKK